MRTNAPATPMVNMIIAGAMIWGVVLFGLIAFFVIDPGKPPADEPLVAVIMAGLGVTSFLAAMLIPPMRTSVGLTQIKSQPRAKWEEELMGLFQSRLIIRMAILEGGAMANLVAFVLERQNWTLLVVGWLVLTMLAFFPTPGGTRDWIKEQMELLNLDM